MSNLNEDSGSHGRDTSPLNLEQLSDYELKTILEIEQRFHEAQEPRLTQDLNDALAYCQQTQLRDPRVLLVDGGRGSGKTSLLLTMAAWWHDAKRDRTHHRKVSDQRKERLERLLGSNAQGIGLDIPENVRVLRIIDFDPLPPEMPLISGIVQALRPLANHVDGLSGHEHTDGLLIDLWQNLFQVATVGWTTIAGGKGLIELILDREEQVKDWYEVSNSWQTFIDRVISRESQFKNCDARSLKPVFVIMIDDVDLQVRRIRELLPALRMLYHPNVFFIVAGDRHHMVDMLELDYQGQQRRLDEAQYHEPIPVGRLDQWPRTLARAAFQKVFAPTNIWSLKGLGLRDLLAFSNLKDALNKWVSTSQKLGAYKGLGDYLARIDGVGRFSDEASIGPRIEDNARIQSSAKDKDQTDLSDELPPIMHYRRAHQLSEFAKVRHLSRNTALELVAQIIDDPDSPESQIRLVAARDGRDMKLEYLASGELVANFPKVFGVEIRAGKEITLSGRPKIYFRNGFDKELRQKSDDRPNNWRQMLAASLRADGFGLVASGLQWNVNLALAWTRVLLSDWREHDLDLAFWWRVHLLPSPLRFVAWSRDWDEFIQKLSERAETMSGGEEKSSQSERIAYGWIYYQLYWMSKSPSQFSKRVLHPLEAKVGEKNIADWTTLLKQEPDKDFLNEERDDEPETWKNRTLPLLARPELFLPPHVQKLLLEPIEKSSKVTDDLRVRRRKLITDAIAAAQYPSDLPEKAAPPKGVIDLEGRLNSEYENFYDKPSPWLGAVDGPAEASKPIALEK